MAAALKSKSPVVLFGYDSSAFTQKIRLALRLKQIPYTFVLVPSMLPRPLLHNHFNITYRKIPVLTLGREAYIDTSLQTEALESSFPTHNSLYPPQTRPLTRLLTSFWTDRPLFRQTCGLMPSSVWASQFGTDRASLIGHPLDPAKLERKIPQMMSGLDLHLSLLESLLQESKGDWALSSGEKPSMLDISIFYQLNWGREIAKGNGVADLTAGSVPDGGEPGAEGLFNRYPAISTWYDRCKTYFDALPTNETRIERADTAGFDSILSRIEDAEMGKEVPLLPTPAQPYEELDARNGLVVGSKVSIAPTDTGMNHPSIGTLVGVGPEEVVIVPDAVDGGEGVKKVDVRLHFPRVEFRMRPV